MESLLRGTGADVSNTATTEAVVVGGYPGLGVAGLCESGGGVVTQTYTNLQFNNNLI